MTKETTKMHITARLSRLQKALKAPKESNKNVSYKSRSAEQILEAAKDQLQDGEYIICQDEIVNIGNRFYVKATTTFGYEGDVVEAFAYAREPDEAKMMAPAQVTGASSSYSRKYSLQGLLAIDDSKDDPDKKSAEDHDDKPEAEKPKELTPQQEAYARITKAIKEATEYKTLVSIMHLNDKEIKTLPQKGQDAIDALHKSRAMELMPVDENSRMGG